MSCNKIVPTTVTTTVSKLDHSHGCGLGAGGEWGVQFRVGHV